MLPHDHREPQQRNNIEPRTYVQATVSLALSLTHGLMRIQCHRTSSHPSRLPMGLTSGIQHTVPNWNGMANNACSYIVKALIASNSPTRAVSNITSKATGDLSSSRRLADRCHSYRQPFVRAGLSLNLRLAALEIPERYTSSHLMFSSGRLRETALEWPY